MRLRCYGNTHARVHDSTPSLGAELLRGLDAAIRDVDVEDDNEDEQRQDARG